MVTVAMDFSRCEIKNMKKDQYFVDVSRLLPILPWKEPRTGSFALSDSATTQQYWVVANQYQSIDNLMQWNLYGVTDSLYGWEIDHVVPKSIGGSDDLNNLQPLQWQNNRHKGDDYPEWSCLVTT